MTEYALSGTSNAVSTATGNLTQTFSVGGVSAAVSAASGALSVYPLLDIRDDNGLQIDEIHFESVYAGVNATAKILRLINNMGTAIDLTLTPQATTVPVGSAMDTYKSTYIHESGDDYSNPLDLTLPALTTLDLYVEYHPPSTAAIGEKEWALLVEESTPPSVSVLNWSYVNSLSITGTADGELTNYQIRIIVPYSGGVMNNDFSDIRFYLGDETELKYNLFSKTDGVTATFDVLIPTIPVSPGTVTIYVLSGNVDALDDSSPEDVYLFNDFFPGTTLDTAKWDLNAVNTITSTVNEYLQVTDATHGTGTEYYIYDGTDSGSQHQAKYTLPTNFDVVWDSTINTVLTAMGQVGIGLVASDDTVIVMLGHEDPSATNPSNLIRRGAVTETTWTNKDAGWSDNSTYKIYKAVSNMDTVTYRIKVRGSNISLYEDETKIADTTITSTIDKLAIIAGSTNNTFPTYIELENLRLTQNTPNAPSLGSLGTWTYYVKRLLGIKGGILYKSQELPEFEPIIRHGCRIGGVLYD